MRSLAAFVMRGRIQAVIAVLGLGALSLVVPLVSLLSAAALGLVTLRLGLRPSAWVLGVALTASCLLGVALTGAWLPALLYGLVMWAPIWLAALLLRTSGRLALTLETATGASMLAVGALYLLIENPANFWRETMERLIQPMLEHAPPGFDAAQMSQGVEFFSHYLSGVAATGALTSLVLGLILARWLQAMLYNPGGCRAEFIALRLHRSVVYAGLAVVAVGLAGSGLLAEVAWNLTLPFTVLCLFSGFAVLHALAAGANKFWLVGLYVVLFILPQATLPLALLGLSDAWLDWRRRFGRRS